MDFANLQKKARELYDHQKQLDDRIHSTRPWLVESMSMRGCLKDQITTQGREHEQKMRGLQDQLRIEEEDHKQKMSSLLAELSVTEANLKTQNQEVEALESDNRAIADMLELQLNKAIEPVYSMLSYHLGNLRHYGTDELQGFAGYDCSTRRDRLLDDLDDLHEDIYCECYKELTDDEYREKLEQTFKECDKFDAALKTIQHFLQEVDGAEGVTLALVVRAEAVKQSVKDFLFIEEVPAAYYIAQACFDWLKGDREGAIYRMQAWVEGLRCEGTTIHDNDDI